MIYITGILLCEMIYISDILPQQILKVYISGVLLCQRVYTSDILFCKRLKGSHFCTFLLRLLKRFERAEHPRMDWTEVVPPPLPPKYTVCYESLYINVVLSSIIFSTTSRLG